MVASGNGVFLRSLEVQRDAAEVQRVKGDTEIVTGCSKLQHHAAERDMSGLTIAALTAYSGDQQETTTPTQQESIMSNLNTLPIKHFAGAFFDMHDSDPVEINDEIITTIPDVMGALGRDIINKGIYINEEYEGRVAVDASWTITLDRAHLDRLKNEGRDNTVLNSAAFEEGQDDWLEVRREHVETIMKRIKSAVPSALSVGEDEGEADRWCEDIPFSVFATFTVEPDATIGDMEDAVRPFFEFMQKASAPDAPDEDYIFGQVTLGV